MNAQALQTLPTPSEHQASEHHFTTWDGSSLFYRAWHPGAIQRQAVVLFHGGHEHSGRFDELVRRLDLTGCSIFAWDARGHGRSPGERGYAGHFLDLVRDADAFLRHIEAAHHIPLENIALLGHSVGSVVAATWVHDYAPPIRGMVLGSPAFHVKLYVPLALPALRLWQRIRPHSFVNSYVKPGMLTHDAEEAEARLRDPLISPAIAVPVLTSLFDTAERVIEGANSIRVPTLILSAGSDWVVHRSTQRRFFERLGSQEKALHTLPGFYHEVFHEKERELPIGLAREFLLGLFEKGSRKSPTEFVTAENEGTWRRLSRPLAPLDPRRAWYGLNRLGLQTVGRLSKGVRLGWESGFDSGRTLNHVYENRPQGFGPIGRLIDRLYLDSPGWRGIRSRGENLQGLLGEEIARRRALGRPVHILDVASGPGRYLIDTLARLNDPAVTALCHDRDEKGLAEGRALAESRGLATIRFEPGDAFAAESFANLQPRPDILVVSGLYELFADNALILRSLRAIRRGMAPGGCLIYTGQPHHPQLEYIARVLINRDHQPWVMRPRPQSEMNRLVRAAGFNPGRMRQDDAGIFTVTVATADLEG